MVKRLCFYWLIISLIVSNQSLAETFVYQEKDGTRWITDYKLRSPDFQFIDHYGRPTAALSCRGVTNNIMQRRASKYSGIIHQYAEQQNLDPLLIKAIIRAESCFDRRAISRAGARGLMQLMPQTARQYGVLDSFNAEDNIRAGITHLSALLVHFKGSQAHSIAAYNAGIRAVERYNGVPPYQETQKYVKKVLKYYAEYKKQTQKNLHNAG